MGTALLVGGPGWVPPGEAGGEPPAAQVAPRGPVPFQPGVAIEWQAPAVMVESHVVLRRGPLEFFACGGGKEHESILRLEASAAHIYMALGLIGLQPGHPPEWDAARDDYGRPTGALLEITCEWEEGGRARSADAFDWLREIAYARQPIARPWVLAGSVRRRDGSLAADHSGAAFALVDFPDSLITLSRGYPSDYSAMWVVANTAEIPSIGARVRLVLRPARPRSYSVVLDFRGDLYVDERYCPPADLADLLVLARQLEPDRVQPVITAGALRSDVAWVRRALLASGCPEEALHFCGGPAGSRPRPPGREP